MKKISLLATLLILYSVNSFAFFDVKCKSYDKPSPTACEYQLKMCYNTNLIGLQWSLFRIVGVDTIQVQSPYYEGCGSCDYIGTAYESNMVPAGVYLMKVTLHNEKGEYLGLVAYEIFYGPDEVCDGIDNNCNGQVDEGFGSCNISMLTSATNSDLSCNSGTISGNVNLAGCSIIRIDLFLINNGNTLIDSKISTLPFADFPFAFAGLSSGRYNVVATALNYSGCTFSSIVDVRSCPRPVITSIISGNNSVEIRVQNAACERLVARCQANGIIRTGTGSGNRIIIRNLLPNTNYQAAIVNQCASNPNVLSERRTFTFTTSSVAVTKFADTSYNGLSNVKIYPNPANSILNIELPVNYKGNFTMQLQNTHGYIFKNQQIISARNGLNYQMDVSNIPNGIYVLLIIDESGITTEKITVKH